MFCPECHRLMEKKAINIGKAITGAVVGAVMLGPVGLAGGLFGLGVYYQCPDCGKKIEEKQTQNAHAQVGKTLTQEGIRQFKAGYNSAFNDKE